MLPWRISFASMMLSIFWIASCFPTAAESPTDDSPTYTSTAFRVVHVPKGDVLHIRAKPSPEGEDRGTIPYDATSIVSLGSSANVSGSSWLLIDYFGKIGWVNSHFVAETGKYISRDALGQILNAAGIGITYLDNDENPVAPYGKQYSNKCVDVSSEARNRAALTVSDEYVEHYRQRGFTLTTACLALTTLMARDVETGVALPTIQYAMYGLIPLNIPNCFKNGTPFFDCKINYDPYWPGDAKYDAGAAKDYKKIGIALDRAANSSKLSRVLCKQNEDWLEKVVGAEGANLLYNGAIHLDAFTCSSELPRGYAYRFRIQTTRGDPKGSDRGLQIGARETKKRNGPQNSMV